MIFKLDSELALLKWAGPGLAILGVDENAGGRRPDREGMAIVVSSLLAR
jgi:hypothetical protein